MSFESPPALYRKNVYSFFFLKKEILSQPTVEVPASSVNHCSEKGSFYVLIVLYGQWSLTHKARNTEDAPTDAKDPNIWM